MSVSEELGSHSLTGGGEGGGARGQEPGLRVRLSSRVTLGVWLTSLVSVFSSK